MSVSELRPSCDHEREGTDPEAAHAGRFRLPARASSREGPSRAPPACRRSSVTWRWRPQIAYDSLRDLGEYLRIGVGLGPQLAAEVEGLLQGECFDIVPAGSPLLDFLGRNKEMDHSAEGHLDLLGRIQGGRVRVDYDHRHDGAGRTDLLHALGAHGGRVR